MSTRGYFEIYQTKRSPRKYKIHFGLYGDQLYLSGINHANGKEELVQGLSTKLERTKLDLDSVSVEAGESSPFQRSLGFQPASKGLIEMIKEELT